MGKKGQMGGFFCLRLKMHHVTAFHKNFILECFVYNIVAILRVCVYISELLIETLLLRIKSKFICPFFNAE